MRPDLIEYYIQQGIDLQQLQHIQGNQTNWK